MRIADFALERYFARWEFAVEHVLGASDVEGWSMAELVGLADDETRAMWAGLRLGYTESTGHPKLRAEIAALYDTVAADDVLVFAGAEEALFCLFTTSVEAGDHVIVTWPGYQSLYEVARAAGAHVSLHALREEDGWSLDVDRLIRSFRPETRMVVVNAPHNPTGMLPSGRTGPASPARARRRGSGWSPTRSTGSSSTTARPRCRRAQTSTRAPSRSASCPSRSRWPACASAGWRREIARSSIAAPG